MVDCNTHGGYMQNAIVSSTSSSEMGRNRIGT